MKSISKIILLTLSLAFLSATTSCHEQEMLVDADGVSAQSATVPELIANDFQSQYPLATSVVWEVDSVYASASFILNNICGTTTNSNVWYNLRNQKKAMETTTVNYSDIPEAVKTAYESGDYGTWEHSENVTLVTRYDNTTVTQIYIIKATGSLSGSSKTLNALLAYTNEGVLVKVELSEVRSLNDVTVEDRHDYDKWLINTLPDYVSAYVNANYPNARYLSAYQQGVVLAVKILDGHTVRTLEFDTNGNWIATLTKVEFKNLPEAVRNAVQSDAFGYEKISEINECTTATEHYYIFTVKDNKGKNTEVRINDDGTIEGGTSNGDNDNDNADSDNDSNVLATYADVEAFIQNRYPGAVIKDNDSDNKKLNLELLYDGIKIDVEFSRSTAGYEWVSSEWDLDYRQESAVPEAIQTVLNTTYSGYQLYYITYVESAAKGNYYEVGLKANRQSLKVVFSTEGEVIAEYKN